ncbi:tetratricopeptide repeat protein [Caviibacter abscessus]|uniref:tetratricopeptide repeat protein n=1 Tax=Caviibacter abscessus TaxID=1766719 RepID=UPI000834BC76|nr:tetratricopeptide repeat protein [Caviibacter abscessus]
MKKVLFVLLLLGFVSCGKKEEKQTVNNTDTKNIVPIEIVKNDLEENKENTLFQGSFEKNYEKYTQTFTDAQKEILTKDGINFDKLGYVIFLSQSGDKEAILTLAQIYGKYQFKEKYISVLELGKKYNIEEALYGLTIYYLNDKNLDKALENANLLPNKKEYKNIKAQINQNLGVIALQKKDFEKAITYLKKAYENGEKKVDLQLAFAYANLNKNEEAKTWLEKGYKRGEKSVGYDLAAMYFNSGEHEKALPLLLEQHKLGHKELELAIGISYNSKGDNENAIKWLEMAKNNGNEQAKLILDEINKQNSKKEGSYDVGE